MNKLTKTQKLYDTWRKVNPEKIEFTYHRPLSDIHSRLDRIYASNNLQTTKSEILPFQHSDHEASLTEFTVRARARDPGYWKLNTSILEHETFKTTTKNFWLDWQKQNKFLQKYNHLVGKATHYCVLLQKNIRNKQTKLTQFIKNENIKPNPDQHKINKAHQHFEDIENYKTTGSIIRSKEKLIVEQEKPNKFFYDQEKQKQKQKTIKKLQKQQNNETITITNGFEILKHCKQFYSTLYTKTQNNLEIKEKF